jgi:methylated-DNA-[protein]-cysteine S-methyltransferase
MGSSSAGAAGSHEVFAYESPIGPIAVRLAGGVLVEIRFSSEALGADELPSGHPVCRWLDAYFAGHEPGPEIGVEMGLRATPFQRAVLDATSSIPWGQVRTYGWVASQIGRPGAARAVGRALGTNPLPLVIPCHRVVASGTGGGYGGGMHRKEYLLALERRARSPAATG